MIGQSVDAGGIAEVVVDYPPVNALPVAGWFALAETLRSLGAGDTERSCFRQICCMPLSRGRNRAML